MKRAEKLSDLKVGQVIYDDEKGEKEYIVRSLEDKLVPYVVSTDNSCHCLRSGVWYTEN